MVCLCYNHICDVEKVQRICVLNLFNVVLRQGITVKIVIVRIQQRKLLLLDIYIIKIALQ